jgi:DNA modification methylase
MTWRNEILLGDVRERLQDIPDESVQCVVTSPPYWKLRDYETGSWDGGDPDCDHQVVSRSWNKGNQAGQSRRPAPPAFVARKECRCGAKRIDNQLGLEDTVAGYVENMVAVFREVRRVLRPDGTLWLNVGDSHAGSWGAQGRRESTQNGADLHRHQITNHPKTAHHTGTIRDAGLKPKDLVGIPWRLAFALQADGWWLRSDIIWSKPNPMPESVTDRPTRSHEYLFLLTKSEHYFYDAESIKEKAVSTFHDRTRKTRALLNHKTMPEGLRNGIRPGKQAAMAEAASPSTPEENGTAPTMRNKRTVWEIPTEPFGEKHYATYPQALVRPCIQAGSREGDVVLDPFMGSGTTALVALKCGRDFTGVELNPKYLALSERRIARFRRRLL